MRKKIQQVAKERSIEFRGRFFAEVQHYSVCLTDYVRNLHA